MATVVKRPSGKWQATVRKDGRSQSKSFLKRSDAAKWAREAELRADQGQLVSARNAEVPEMTLNEVMNRYALTELVQWLFRSAIRVGGLNGTGRAYMPRRPVTLYMPSQRMRNLLLNWLLTGKVNSGPVKAKDQRQREILDRLEGRLVGRAA